MEDFRSLRDIADEIAANPDIIDSMTPEQLNQVAKRFAGERVDEIKVEKSYACVSHINLRDKFFRRFATTALVGFQGRQIEEYEPRDELVKIEAAMEPKIAALRLERENAGRSGEAAYREADAKLAAMEAELEARRRLIIDTTRRILRQFHRDVFRFDPDKHIRAAAVDHGRRGIDAKKLIENCFPGGLTGPLGWTGETVQAETFHSLDRYIGSHYDELRRVTETLYCEREIWDNLFVFYRAFDDKAKGEAWIQAQEDYATTDLILVESGATVMTETLNNRLKTTYLNRDSHILHEIQQQNEADQKLGRDMMRKRVKKVKTANVKKFGAEPKLFQEYVASQSEIAGALGKRSMTHEEQEKIAAEAAAEPALNAGPAADGGRPDDAIQVDILSTACDADGRDLEMSRNIMWTQAEAPLHLEKDSPYANQYQPVRDPGVSIEEAQHHEVVIGQDGRKSDVTIVEAPKRSEAEVPKQSEAEGKK